MNDRYIACGLFQNGNTNATVWTPPFTSDWGDLEYNAKRRCALASGGSPEGGFDKILVYPAPETPILTITP